jgi:hypothetical protein
LITLSVLVATNILTLIALITITVVVCKRGCVRESTQDLELQPISTDVVGEETKTVDGEKEEKVDGEKEEREDPIYSEIKIVKE